LIPDVADIAAIAHVRAIDPGADTNNVIDRGNVTHGAGTQGRVVPTGGIGKKRCLTYGRICDAGVVGIERFLGAFFAVEARRPGVFVTSKNTPLHRTIRLRPVKGRLELLLSPPRNLKIRIFQANGLHSALGQ
jgi:hypothetical protein